MSDEFLLRNIKGKVEAGPQLVSKDIIFLNDNNSLTYSNGMLLFDTQSMANVNGFMCLNETEILMPITIRMEHGDTGAAMADATGNTPNSLPTTGSVINPNQFWVGTKAGSHFFFDSVYASINGVGCTNVVRSGCVLSHWRLLTSTSPAAQPYLGAKYLFHPDTSDSVRLTVNANGLISNDNSGGFGYQGLYNNVVLKHIGVPPRPMANYMSDNNPFLCVNQFPEFVNQGLVERCKVLHEIVDAPLTVWTAANAANQKHNVVGESVNSRRNVFTPVGYTLTNGVTPSSAITTSVATTWGAGNKFSQLIGIDNYAAPALCMSTIEAYIKCPLRHLHDLFEQLDFPVRGCRLILQLGLNQATSSVTQLNGTIDYKNHQLENQYNRTRWTGHQQTFGTLQPLMVTNAGSTVAMGGTNNVGTFFPGDAGSGVTGLTSLTTVTSSANYIQYSNCIGGNAAIVGFNAVSAAAAAQSPSNYMTGGSVGRISYVIGTTKGAANTTQLMIPIVQLPVDYIDAAISRNQAPRQISYLDHQWMVLPQVASRGNQMQIYPTQGVKNMRRIWMFLNPPVPKGPAVTGAANAVAVVGNSSWQSPIATEPATVTPGHCLTDIQVLIGGQSMTNTPIKYSYEFFKAMFEDNVYAGGQDTVMRIGLIDEHMWQRCYGAYVFNMTRAIKAWPLNEALNLQINFTNQNAWYANFDVHLFIEYEKVLSLNQQASFADILVAG